LSPSLRTPFVRDERAARVHVFVSEFAGKNGPRIRTEISSSVCPCSRKERLLLQPDLAEHHRVFHAGAVLGVVNALRCASTRPTAGPLGIDDASARHASGSCAMVVSVPITRTILTKASRAYVGVIASVPHGTPSVRLKGQRSAHPVGALRARHRAQSSPHRSPVHDDRGRLIGTPMSCEPRDLSRRIILRIKRREGDAFTSGIASPWSD